MSRPGGGYKCRSWRLKKKRRKWCHVLAFRIWEQTLDTLADGAITLRSLAYRKYDLYNQFWQCGKNTKRIRRKMI